MDNRSKTQPTLESIKRQAKRMKKDQNITHTQALEIIARQLGFSNYAHCVNVLSDFKKSNMKQDKNFVVRLQATIERKMREAGICDMMLNGSKHCGEYDKVQNKFFELLKGIRLSDLNKDPDTPVTAGKQYWLVTAHHLSLAGTPWGPFTPFDGPHDSPAGVAMALELHQCIKAVMQSAGTLFCMLEVSPVPDLPVQVNQEAVETLNDLCPHGPSIGPYHDCPLAFVGLECRCINQNRPLGARVRP